MLCISCSEAVIQESTEGIVTALPNTMPFKDIVSSRGRYIPLRVFVFHSRELTIFSLLNTFFNTVDYNITTS